MWSIWVYICGLWAFFMEWSLKSYSLTQLFCSHPYLLTALVHWMKSPPLPLLPWQSISPTPPPGRRWLWIQPPQPALLVWPLVPGVIRPSVCQIHTHSHHPQPAMTTLMILEMICFWMIWLVVMTAPTLISLLSPWVVIAMLRPSGLREFSLLRTPLTCNIPSRVQLEKAQVQ